MAKSGKIKTESCSNYHIYELNRKNKIGVGVAKHLEPVLIVKTLRDTFKDKLIYFPLKDFII